MQSCEQIEILQHLKQQSMAWLINRAPRTLRDRGDIPRQPDGTYNAKEVLAWSRGADIAQTIRNLPDGVIVEATEVFLERLRRFIEEHEQCGA